MVKQVFRRFFCLFFALAVFFLRSVPVYASGVTQGASGSGVPVGLELGVDVVSLADMAFKTGVGLGNFCRHFMDNDVCPLCTDLTGQHDFVPKRTLIDGKVGVYYTCRYCGKSAGEVMETAYQEYVDTLPGTRYNSDGAFLWVPTFDNFSSSPVWIFIGGSRTGSFSSSQSVFTYSRSGSGATCFFTLHTLNKVSCYYVGWVGDFYTYIQWPLIQNLPCAGLYESLSGVYSDSFSASLAKSGQIPSSNSSSLHLLSGSFDGDIALWPAFWVTPFTPFSGSTFSADSRLSGSGVANSGLYGYVRDGQLYQSTVGDIYNETTNIYQNPVTGDTSNISSWEYDYSDRSYTLTTDEGDNVTVTYGDSNVTINEGGTTYNVYYLIEETEELQQELEESGSYCDHDYRPTVTTAPTCTTGGVKTYTCSICGDTYTEAIPATGHSHSSSVTMEPTCIGTGVRTFVCSVCGDTYTVSIAATGHRWRLVRQEPTVYDESGQLVTAGYLLYQCDTCAEQYRLAAESGGAALPSPAPDSATTSGDIEIDSGVGRGFLATIAHGLTEDLPEVLHSFSTWFVEFPRFYSGFAMFLKEGIFVCLPDECQRLIGFGFGMVTAVGIVRKIIRR